MKITTTNCSAERSARQNQRAFTLIELMIVVAIIGIIAAIAIPMYSDYMIRSQVAEGINLAGGAKTAVSEFYLQRGAFPTDNNEAALAPATGIQGNYVAAVSVSGPAISVLFGNDANANISGQTIVLTAANNTGSLSWTCASGGVIITRHLPPFCR